MTSKINSAEELARQWWENNATVIGDHTGGLYMSVRDFVDIVIWLGPNNESKAEEEAIKILTPIAEKYLAQDNKTKPL